MAYVRAKVVFRESCVRVKCGLLRGAVKERLLCLSVLFGNGPQSHGYLLYSQMFQYHDVATQDAVVTIAMTGVSRKKIV